MLCWVDIHFSCMYVSSHTKDIHNICRSMQQKLCGLCCVGIHEVPAREHSLLLCNAVPAARML